ncbi:MAG: hypothetical protein JXD22_07225 [Sedimentisphaerales bacterium]|nr:hypothetical protein [Sedimentisphaerales bacterium]
MKDGGQGAGGVTHTLRGCVGVVAKTTPKQVWRCHPAGRSCPAYATDVGYFAPSGLRKCLCLLTRGDALGYNILPRWGFNVEVSGWLIKPKKSIERAGVRKN